MIIPEKVTHAISKTYTLATSLEQAMNVEYKGSIKIEYKNHTTKTWYLIEGTLKEQLHKIASTIVLYGPDNCEYRIVG